ncbi:GT99 family glycosyltransferase N-terminal domain-containing protein [Pantoea sp.]|uniref:GT99 family glycosyltransferase N-terminal domain-containing protein n=1 Tax=Pantoea sp. TaxID=69393 RepID=UPI0025DF34B3|nr:hypothetical protein [Pantoea sp.]
MASKKSKYIFFWLPFDVKYSYETFLTAFYLSVKRFPCNDAIHIGHEQIFQDVPSHLPQNWLAGFNTELPCNEEIRALDKIIWNSDIFSELEGKLKSKNLVWEHILTKDYAPLLELFESELIRLKKEFDIKAVILWSNCPSVKKIANTHNIPVIHNELGPLRDPIYLPTCYFDFSGVNGHTEAAERFKNYNSTTDKYVGFGRLALLSLFLRVIKPIRKFNEYEIGVPLQVEDDSNIIAYSNGFDNPELINYAKNRAMKVLIRKHPFGRIDYKDIENGSEDLTPQEFIALCEKIITINSSVGFEALLWGKPSEILGDSPFSFIRRDSAGFVDALRFALLNYLVPFDFLFNKEYYDWRITMPDEDSIREKHLFYYLNLKHGWNETNININTIPIELENIFFRNFNLQFVENENYFRSEAEELTKKLKEFNSDRAKKEVGLLNSELSKKNQELESAVSKKKHLEDELLCHQHLIEGIYASKSWRLTKPLRVLNSLKSEKKTAFPLKRKVAALVLPITRKVLANYQARKLAIAVTKKIGLYGKLKSIYLQITVPVAAPLVDVSNESQKSKDTVINLKKIKMLKRQRGND